MCTDVCCDSSSWDLITTTTCLSPVHHGTSFAARKQHQGVEKLVEEWMSRHWASPSFPGCDPDQERKETDTLAHLLKADAASRVDTRPAFQNFVPPETFICLAHRRLLSAYGRHSKGALEDNPKTPRSHPHPWTWWNPRYSLTVG